MKFGKVAQPELVDFTLPESHPDTIRLLKKQKKDDLSVYVGCAKWNKTDLKGFYPKGVKEELSYYATQFNAIELNATFYRQFPAAQFEKWYGKTPENFKFFPKLNQEISHWKRLANIEDTVNTYLYNASNLKEKLGTIFLQMHSNFGTKNFDRLYNFAAGWPKNTPLAVECRHPDWFSDTAISGNFYQLLEDKNMANVIVDTAGRRDMLHMRLTNNEAFIRYVGANHASDYDRLDAWVIRLKEWVTLGLRKIHFFIHQNLEKESPLLAAHFIENLNKELNLNLHIPEVPNNRQSTLTF
ncbi:MAG: DUF72 domain-containing protein [Flavobacteriaceae bacterium]|nr:MAG: DUF72 domain-containing protein [Flavobacteriaceae bacterium]